METILSIKEQNISLTQPIEVIAFSDEEGRFGSMIGSKVMCGLSDDTVLLQAQDENARTLAQALSERGKSLTQITQAQRSHHDFKAFIELHIEQGPLLDQKQIDIGIVENIVGISRWRACYLGQANHAGTTPMDMRKDAVMGLVHFAQELNQIIQQYGSPNARATIGRVVTHPGYIGVIAQKVEFTLDLRDVSQEKLAILDQVLEEHARLIAQQQHLEFQLTRVGQLKAMQCHPSLTQYIENISDELGYTSLRMTSGALHDTINLSALTDVAMIFVPSIQGISHSGLEETHPQHLEKGAQLLGHVLLSLACGKNH